MPDRQRLDRARRLGHRVDARAAAPAASASAAVVQRRVGFEFQTDWQLEPDAEAGWFDKKLAKLYLSPAFKSDALVQGDGWGLTNDDGEVEFITEPFEEGDFGRLAGVFADLDNEADLLEGGPDPFRVRDFAGVTNLGRVTQIQPGTAGMPANPQMTGGVAPEFITEIMADLGQTAPAPSQARQDLVRSGKRGDILREVSAHANGLGATPAYQGIVALMASYISASCDLRGVSTSVKDVTTLMSRTNLGTAFARTTERLNATTGPARAQLKTGLLNDVLATANAAQAALGLRQFGAVAGGTRLFPPTLEEINAQMQLHPFADPDVIGANFRSGPTIQEWVNGIVDGSDSLATTNFSELLRFNSRSMGVKGLEDVGPAPPMGPRNQGLQLEFRDLDRVSRAEWLAWATRLLLWISRINDPAEVNRTFE